MGRVPKGESWMYSRVRGSFGSSEAWRDWHAQKTVAIDVDAKATETASKKLERSSTVRSQANGPPCSSN